MRKILVDWLVDVHRKFKLRHETLFMAVNLIDRFMEAATEPMQKNKFQLFGVTCLFIASKYEEIYPPSLSDFVYVCADTYTADMVLEMEGIVLNQLGFNLVYSSSLQILGVYSQQRRPLALLQVNSEREKRIWSSTCSL
jgi:G2/mitotic-specific cyclin-B, other